MQDRASVSDIYLHRRLSGLEGSPHHAHLAFGVSRASKKSDGYRQQVWVLTHAHPRPKAWTVAAHGAVSPKWSPEGDRLAFLSNREASVMQMHVLSTDGGEARRVTRIVGDLSLTALQDWSPDASSLLVLASLPWIEDGEEKDTGNQRAPQVARFLPYKLDGSGITVGGRTHLYVVDSRSGATSCMASGDFDVSLARWSPDGTRIAFTRNRTTRQRHRTDVWIADAPDGGNARCLVSDLAAVSEVKWAPDGRRLALAASDDVGDSRTGIWLVEVGDGSTLKRWGDKDFEIDAASGMAWHPDGHRLAVVRMYLGLQQLVVLEADGDDLRSLAAKLKNVSGIAHWGERLAYISTSMRQLEEVYSTTWELEATERHSRFNRAWFSRRAKPHVRKRRIEVADGDGVRERIDVWLLTPSQGQPPFPVLVDMHGGPHSAVMIDYDAHTYWYLLLQAGWAIVAPNAVGSSGYGHEFARRLQGRWGELDLPQFEAVVHALQEEGLADDRVVCAGKSYGGFLSAYAVGHSELFRAAIVCAPVANIESHFGTSDSGYYVTPFAMGGEVDDERPRYQRISPITRASAIEAAVLILQGENDGRCPRGQSEELFSHIIRSTDAPVELVVYPTSTHAEAESGKPSNRVDYHARLVAWACRWGGESTVCPSFHGRRSLDS